MWVGLVRWVGDHQIVCRWAVGSSIAFLLVSPLGFFLVAALCVSMSTSIPSYARSFSVSLSLWSVRPRSSLFGTECLLLSSFLASVMISYHVFFTPAFVPGVRCPSTPVGLSFDTMDFGLVPIRHGPYAGASGLVSDCLTSSLHVWVVWPKVPHP